jgi:hypothetical protein
MPAAPPGLTLPPAPWATACGAWLRAAWRRGCALWLLVLCAVLPVHATGTVRVGVYENSPKIGFDATGKPQGIFIDLIEAIAREEGWTLVYVPGTFGEGLARLSSGQIDLMPDVALTSERGFQYAFHREPVLLSWSQVYARRGSGIRSLLDLDGRRVAALDASVQQEFVRQMAAGFSLQLTLVPRPDFASAFRAVAEGQADAVVTNRFYGARHAADSGLEDTAIVFSPSQLYFAARAAGDPSLLAAIDRQLLALKADRASAYHRALERWTTGELRTVLPPWAKWAMLAGTTLLLVTVAWGVTLRRSVVHLRESRRRQRELVVNLAQARDAAEAADRVKSAFLATMSHELRTPLNSIIGFTGIVLRGMAGPLNDEQRRQLTMVRSSANHLLALINDVLDISKIEAGQVELDRAPFALAASVGKVMALVAPLATQKGLALSAQLAPDLGEMTGDVRRFEQVLLNLLGNAIKFTDRGSVTLEAKHRSAWQAEPGAPAVDAVEFCVSDTGIGLKPEDQALLFQPFRQVDARLSRAHEGTGLGLAICHRLVSLMGGRIGVESVWQQGSRFSVTLPLVPG